MTTIQEHDKPRRMGRKLEFPEQLRLSLPAGTIEKVDSVLKPGEARLDMLRDAVEREVARRRREAKKAE